MKTEKLKAEMLKSAREAAWIETHGGRSFHFLDPELIQIDITDIAHALANTCRFGGHTDVFYSVAQHSVLVSRMADAGDALAGLLHDAAEAYLGDIPTPLKNILPEFKRLEHQIEGIIFYKFDVPLDLPQSVRDADLRALATEQRDLLGNRGFYWEQLRGVMPHPARIMPMTPAESKTAFLKRYSSLTGRVA